MEAVKVTNLHLTKRKDDIIRYSLKIDGDHYYYEIYSIIKRTELTPLKSVRNFSRIEGIIVPMDVTNPQKTIEQFYKVLMLQ